MKVLKSKRTKYEAIWSYSKKKTFFIYIRKQLKITKDTILRNFALFASARDAFKILEKNYNSTTLTVEL